MKLKKVMLAIGVGVLAALFVGFLIDAIYENPRWEKFCPASYYASETKPYMQQQTNCSFTYDTQLEKECTTNEGAIRYEYDAQGCVSKETCNYCERDYRKANELYSKNLFLITAPIGLLLIILGLYLPTNLDAMAGGALLGGILTMIQCTARVFGTLGKWMRVILLGAELVIVIWIGIKKVQDNILVKKKK